LKLFRDIKAFLEWRQNQVSVGNPYDLTEDDTEELIHLSFTKEWDFYTRLLDNAIYIEAENLLTSPPELVEKLRGTILGLRKAGTILSQIAEEKEQRDARGRDRERDRESRELARNRNTFATPFWNPDSN
jgi:hypothetical protein